MSRVPSFGLAAKRGERAPASDVDEVARQDNLRCIALGSLCVCVFVLTAIDAKTTHYLPTLVERYVRWTEANRPWSLLLYVLTAICCILCTLPLGALVAAAGVLFVAVYGYAAGILLAILAMLSAEVTAGITALYIGRFLFRPSLRRAVETDTRFRIVKAMDKMVSTQGIEVTIVVRSAPAPSGILSYILGSTAVSVSHFAIGTVIVAIPYIAAACFVSASAMNFQEFVGLFFQSPGRICLFVLVMLVAVVACVLFTQRVQTRYNQLLAILDEEEGREEELVQSLAASEKTDGEDYALYVAGQDSD